MCDFLDTATVCPDEGKGHKMIGHKFEIRIVVYRDGDELKAFPSIAKVGVCCGVLYCTMWITQVDVWNQQGNFGKGSSSLAQWGVISVT